MKRITFGIAAAGLLFAAAPVQAQQPLGRPIEAERVGPGVQCPAADPGEGMPIEVRVGGRLIRAQVLDRSGEGDGARVDVRLVGCEASAGARADADPSGRERADADVDGRGAGSPLLRLIHDLTVGLELGPTEDGRCIRARFAIRDQAGVAEDGTPGAPLATDEQPKDIEICGFPFAVGGGD